MNVLQPWQFRPRQCAVLLALFCLGCKSYTAPALMPFGSKSDTEATAKKKEKPIEFGTPNTMAVVWVDSVLTPPGRESVRGFGGRAFFYDEDGQAIRVDGDFVVYAYNDTDERLKSNVPDRKYVFRAEELQGHHTESEFGSCYNFWVPWDQIGGSRTTVTLLPKLTVKSGGQIYGQQSVNVLPGTDNKLKDDPYIEEVTRSQTRIRSPGITRQNDYSDEENLMAGIDPTTLNRTSIRSTTLEMPPSLARQMQMNQQMAMQQQQQQPQLQPPGNGMKSQADMEQLQKQMMTPQPINTVSYGSAPIYGPMGNAAGATANVASTNANQANARAQSGGAPYNIGGPLDLPGHIPAESSTPTTPPSKPSASYGFGVPGPLTPR